MSQIRLYLDEDSMGRSLVRALRARAIDVRTTSEEGLVGGSGQAQLRWAIDPAWITNIEALKAQVPDALAACRRYFPGVDRTVSGYEGLLAAQERLPNNETRDAFARYYSRLTQIWTVPMPDHKKRGFAVADILAIALIA